MPGQERPDKDKIRHGRQQQIYAVQRHRPGGEASLPHPGGDEGSERQPQQQVEIGPEDTAVYLLNCLK